MFTLLTPPHERATAKPKWHMLLRKQLRIPHSTGGKMHTMLTCWVYKWP
jgi:hypothetical protein